MDQAELTRLLGGLIATWENEVVELKQANDNFSTDDIDKYFSALANEANLRGADFGWLVFGVNTRSGCLQNESACRSHISAYKSIT